MNLDLNEITLNDTDTALPILAPGVYRFRIEETEALPNKAGTGHNLRVKFTLDEPAETTKGDVVQNFTLFRYYPLQQSDNPKAPDFKRDLAKLYEAAYPEVEQADRPPLGVAVTQVIGRFVRCSVKVETSDQYGESNAIGAVMADA